MCQRKINVSPKDTTIPEKPSTKPTGDQPEEKGSAFSNFIKQIKNWFNK